MTSETSHSRTGDLRQTIDSRPRVLGLAEPQPDPFTICVSSFSLTCHRFHSLRHPTGAFPAGVAPKVVERPPWDIRANDDSWPGPAGRAANVTVCLRWRLCENVLEIVDYIRVAKVDLVERPTSDDRMVGNGFGTPNFLILAPVFEFSHNLAAVPPFETQFSVTVKGRLLIYR